jgi:hypothetical protein
MPAFPGTAHFCPFRPTSQFPSRCCLRGMRAFGTYACGLRRGKKSPEWSFQFFAFATKSGAKSFRRCFNPRTGRKWTTSPPTGIKMAVGRSHRQGNSVATRVGYIGQSLLWVVRWQDVISSLIKVKKYCKITSQEILPY